MTRPVTIGVLALLLCGAAVAAPPDTRGASRTGREQLSAPLARAFFDLSTLQADMGPAARAVAAQPNVQGCFLNLRGIVGECRSQAYLNWTEVQAFSQATNANWILTRAHPHLPQLDIGPLVVTKLTDGTTGRLALGVGSKATYAAAQLDLIRPDCVLTIFLKDACVGALRPVTVGANQAADELTITFGAIEITYRERDRAALRAPINSVRFGSTRPCYDVALASDALAQNPGLTWCFADLGGHGGCHLPQYLSWSRLETYVQPAVTQWSAQPGAQSVTATAGIPLTMTLLPEATAVGAFRACVEGTPLKSLVLDDLRPNLVLGLFLKSGQVTGVRWQLNAAKQATVQVSVVGLDLEAWYRSRTGAKLGPAVIMRLSAP